MKTHSMVVVAFTVLALCLSFVVPAVGATSGVETDTKTAIGTQSAEEEVAFVDSSLVKQQGDVATIRLELENTDETRLWIRSAQQDYRTDLRIHDEDGDGLVRVRFNTFYGADYGDKPAFTAVGDDSVSVRAHATTQSLPVLEPGRYNMVASTESSYIAGVLRLEEASAGESRSTAVTPGEDTSTFSDRKNETGPTTVAKGDIGRAEFDVSGIEGLLPESTTSDPLVIATDSRRGTETVHHLRFSPTRDIERVNTISIDYDENGLSPPNVQSLSWNNFETVGVDTDDDGHIDRSLSSSVSGIRTTSSGKITVKFDGNISISESDRIIASYRVSNPDETGSTDVQVRVDSDRYVQTGTIRYGIDDLGTLGHGVDLRLQTADGQPVGVPLESMTPTYDPRTDRLVADVETDQLEMGTYTVQFRIYDESPVPETAAMTERFTVVPASANVSEPKLTNESTLAVNATTNLAPGSRVTTRVQTDRSRNEYLLECKTTVESDGSISCDYELPDSDSPLIISIRKSESLLAEPIRYDPSETAE